VAELEPGLYEELVTRRLRERIDELVAEGRRVREGALDQAEEPDVLARHVRMTVERILGLVEHAHRVAVANDLLRLAATWHPKASELVTDVADGPTRLEEVVTHEGSRPIAITWRLDHPLPTDFLVRAQVLAG
jgi:hypothetical protein